LYTKYISYQLTIKVEEEIEIIIGRLGTFLFPKGIYIYTGSSKKNLEHRIMRHQSKDKKLYWHIDYLLQSPKCNIIDIKLSEVSECELNQSINGKIIIPGFGASDCNRKCSSHLKYIE